MDPLQGSLSVVSLRVPLLNSYSLGLNGIGLSVH